MKKNQIVLNEETNYSSIYLVEQINLFREEEGNRTPLLHKNLLAKIEEEFKEEINGLKIQPVKYKDSKGEMRKSYNLNYDESLQLLMAESKFVRKAVVLNLKALKEENKALLDIQKQTHISRSNASIYFRPMNDCLVEMRALEGKETKSFHYANEANMLNELVFKQSAKKWKEQNPEQAKLGMNQRDFATKEQLDLLTNLENSNAGFIDTGLSYEIRKGMLKTIVERKQKLKELKSNQTLSIN
jgi:hypothetical protein